MKVVEFGSYSIPQAKGEWSFPVTSLRGGRPLLAAAGVWDDLGDLVVLRPGLVQVKFAISSDVSWGDVDDDLDDAKEALFAGRALLKLARGTSGSALRQALARCVSFDVPFKYDKPRLALCTAKFELLQPHWDSISYGGWPPYTTAAFTVNNTSSTCQTQRTLSIRVNGPLSAVYTFTNTTNGMSFAYDGTGHAIPPGQALIVDCGKLTVLHQTVDVWEHFSVGTNQIGFMAFEVGNNACTQSPTQDIRITGHYSYL